MTGSRVSGQGWRTPPQDNPLPEAGPDDPAGPAQGLRACPGMRREGPRLLTVGHGTASSNEFTRLVRAAGVQLVADVRSAPGSRRSPQFGRAEMQAWLPEAGIGYRWEARLGGFRRPVPDSPNVMLRHAAFRGYADYMASDMFGEALAGLVSEAWRQVTAVMCAETLWWRCHRRLIADAAVLLYGAGVWHLGHDGRLTAHELTDGARRGVSGHLIYDRG
ncbi:MAG: DUF488 family protein [Streptosporangiaceae bacterium]